MHWRKWKRVEREGRKRARRVFLKGAIPLGRVAGSVNGRPMKEAGPL